MRSGAFSLVVLAGTVLLPGGAAARLYQWVDPGTGTTQMSGRPPAWYRGSQGGPRILVFEAGRLIDDTAREVPDAEQSALRAHAFAPEAPVRSQERDRIEPTLHVDPAPAPEAVPGEAERHEAAEGTLPGVDQATIERLKAIIGEWDRRQTEAAKHFLEGPQEAAGAPDPARTPR